VAGCGGNAHVQISSAAPAASASTGTTGTVSATSSSVAATALFVLHWGLLNYYWDREAGIYGVPAHWAPPMDETRSVNTQDCTQPIVDRSANLRCR
jgi:hypothetical protein